MIDQLLNVTQHTLLCSGPMSKNCIDASIEIARQYKMPQVLIASRRQVDSAEFGGGYVGQFDTESFSRYVKSHNLPQIFLARDHGGPWQSELEQSTNLNEADAMNSAKRSFEADIDAGFDFIHIDPSIPIRGETLSLDVILRRLFELYEHCYDYAQKRNKNIRFELGTEEQDGYAQDLDKFKYFLSETEKFCGANRIIKPTFVVAQTGTKVMETCNVGVFDQGDMQAQLDCIQHIKDTLQICNDYGIKLKEHNTDYLSNEALSLRPALGVHASNVAPEFGVVETRGLLYLMEKFGFEKERNDFMQIALNSTKWKKWMLPGSEANDLEKVSICGHYVLSHPEVIEIHQKLTFVLNKYNIDLNAFLVNLIKQSMMRYLHLFNTKPLTRGTNVFNINRKAVG
ncbi:class II D-tagatose-bisphosphate aldolase, non-catalytic subunit [uncultured Paraglaciecola sp.]|uniref:class II D-tagatose-bisphosphate aldolase non-catalytic subunit n=1 Tax=uncultured Paraglaciecola sp. TaxID=1765024 RepID=UPI0025D91EFC|nr:class II D-tagatose-bisphosphate aldolase, non-catalytic subunit [uncultured Paraglaciecola sp.]